MRSLDGRPSNQVHDRGEEVSGAPARRPALDHDVGLLLEEDLLVDPEIEGRLQHPHAEPLVLPPAALLVEQLVEATDYLALARCGRSGADGVHGRRCYG
jgi:hypothetical protein